MLKGTIVLVLAFVACALCAPEPGREDCGYIGPHEFC